METAVENIKSVITELVTGKTLLDDIRVHIRDSGPLVRANALNALVSPAKADAGLIKDIVAAARHPDNKVRLMGTIAVAHVAVDCLYQIGSRTALEAATELLAKWPEPDRSDLLWYLRSEGHVPA
jgi:HEAT repeat protein